MNKTIQIFAVCLVCLGCATTQTKEKPTHESPNIIMHIAYTNGDRDSIPITSMNIVSANIAGVDHLCHINDKISSTNKISRISITQTFRAK